MIFKITTFQLVFFMYFLAGELHINFQKSYFSDDPSANEFQMSDLPVDKFQVIFQP